MMLSLRAFVVELDIHFFFAGEVFMSELFSLVGKVALITGSSKGIGKAIAERMAEAGAAVVISSRKLDACEAVAESIRQRGFKAEAIACNISHKSDLENLVAETRTRLGSIDILVCNAAVNPHYGPSSEIPDSAFDKILGCNIRSNHWLCQMVLPDMIANKDGSIIIISSVTGLMGTQHLGTYAISKAADMQLARNLAVENGPHNIRVNCIAPGLIKTDFARALWEDPKVYKAVVRQYPLGRMGEPDEIAGAAVMMAAPAGRFMTGQTLVIDGGGTINE